MVVQRRVLAPGTAYATVGGYAPVITQVGGLRPGAAQIVVIGGVPAIAQPRSISPERAAAVVAGGTPTISQTPTAPSGFYTYRVPAAAMGARIAQDMTLKVTP